MTSPAEKRYDMRRELDGTWTVFDIFTGVAVQAGVSVAMGMEEEFARYLVDIMNTDYPERRQRRNQP
jgi:hypothetical protein